MFLVPGTRYTLLYVCTPPWPPYTKRRSHSRAVACGGPWAGIASARMDDHVGTGTGASVGIITPPQTLFVLNHRALVYYVIVDSDGGMVAMKLVNMIMQCRCWSPGEFNVMHTPAVIYCCTQWHDPCSCTLQPSVTQFSDDCMSSEFIPQPCIP